MKKNLKIILFILFPLIVGSIIGFLANSSNGYQDFIKPSFAPPAILFPIVWSILYLLMGISSYLICKSNDLDKCKAILIYFFQLILNFLWTPIFFGFNLYLLGTIWIFILLLVVIYMVGCFYKIDKVSAYLQIPYILWLIFAFILSIAICSLNC